MRPWGHAGLIFTLGLPWALLAVAIQPTLAIAAAYLGGYFVVRCLLTLMVGSMGLKQRGIWSKLFLIPVWDAVATIIWMASFTRRSIRWRGYDYLIVNQQLVPKNAREPMPAPSARSLDAVPSPALKAHKSSGDI
jgi:ceramide glucosyltransferase